ncbi:hypothetical protein PaecuDRAFT_1621 [Paenibacillus curdlanolyticus YK9]|uniref:GIY-YIG domain-containing protein n=1 Tax=Paenibacillus curdlanolyticus YK9 TaxID=717606 RepID=E0I7M0_9BACL|nr:GIY-YIG nuclease family protein [Paenibacillus curdlanolyticus]EFM11175.1 hypothetical protein PaecuDRAFT_1621 [Paenibacillus curdlanolyticus YK9]
MKNTEQRKALVEQYQDRKREMGVYRIVHVTTNRSFIGSSINLDAAWNLQRFGLNMGNHPCVRLQAAWKLDGEAAFRYETVELLKTGDDVKYDYKDHQLLPEHERRSITKQYKKDLAKLEETCIELERQAGAELFND